MLHEENFSGFAIIITCDLNNICFRQQFFFIIIYRYYLPTNPRSPHRPAEGKQDDADMGIRSLCTLINGDKMLSRSLSYLN